MSELPRIPHGTECCFTFWCQRYIIDRFSTPFDQHHSSSLKHLQHTSSNCRSKELPTFFQSHQAKSKLNKDEDLYYSCRFRLPRLPRPSCPRPCWIRRIQCPVQAHWRCWCFLSSERPRWWDRCEDQYVFNFPLLFPSSFPTWLLTQIILILSTANPLSVSKISSLTGGAVCTFKGIDGSVTTVIGEETVDVGPPQTQISASCRPL